MRHRLSERADLDLYGIYLFGADRFGPDQADRYHQKLLDVFELLARYPWLGRRIEEVDAETRLHVHSAHTILYRVSDDEVLILRVLHGSQDRDVEL